MCFSSLFRWLTFTGVVARLSLLAAVGSFGGLQVDAAPVFLQDYVAPGNLDEPFNIAPGISGTTDGVQASTISHVPSDGANGSIGAAELVIPFDPTTSPGAGGWAWQVRLLSNLLGTSSAANPFFSTDGFVGYWLKVDPTVVADMFTGPVLEPAAGTSEATVGDLQSVIKDGQWHLYQWNMDDALQFNNQFYDIFGLAQAGVLGNTFLEPSNIIDSIAIVSTNGVDATLRIDQIGYDNAGPLVPVPEPSSLATILLGIAGIYWSTRRRALSFKVRHF